jgi:flagellar basal body-associated protein FliL
MKTSLDPQRCSRPSQGGSAVVVVMALLAIMMLLAAANTVTLNWLRSEVRLVEKRQTMRTNTAPANFSAQAPLTTNTPSAQ